MDKECCQRLSTLLTAHSPVVSSEVDDWGSAVTLPLVQRDGELSILFEVRSQRLNWQPGEICLPGGRIESGDDSPQAAAVRETSEELGIGINEIQVVGPLDYIVSPIGVTLYPFVAILQKDAAIKPNHSEVAEVFSVPLKFLLTAEPLTAQMELATRPMANFPFDLLPQGYSTEWKRRKTYKVFFYSYGSYVIWGLTAQVVRNFLTVYRKIC